MKYIVVLSIFLAFSSWSQDPNETPQSKLIGEIIIPEMQRQNIPGVAVAFFYVDRGYIICYGVADKWKKNPVTPDTIFEIASVTKVFTSTDLALQVERGYVTLNDSVTNYLPGIDRYKGALNQVTLLELATHSSSLPREPPSMRGRPQTEQAIVNFLNKWMPSTHIGTQYQYSNLGFGILGWALANREHVTYDQMIANDILRPLGMNSTMTQVPPNLNRNYAQGYTPKGTPASRWRSLLPGGGSLRSTPQDLLLFLEANLGFTDSPELTQAIAIAQQGYFKVNNQLTMGLGWQRFQKNDFLIIDKNGGVPGFSAYIGFILDKKIGVVLLANKSKINSTEIGRRILIKLAQSSSQ